MQSTYQVLVASSPQKLTGNQADVWDSGKTISAHSFSIAYGGKSLKSDTSYYWKVRVWDQNGVPSAWSQPASWTTALLAPSDWKAKWIAAQPDSEAKPRVGRDSATRPAYNTDSKPLPIFRRSFRLMKPVKRARVFITGLGQYELHLNGQTISDDLLTPGWTNYRKSVLYNAYDVTSRVKRGENAIGILLGNGMYNVERFPKRFTKFAGSFGQPKLLFQMNIIFTDGSSTSILSDGSWKTTPGPITFSSMYGGEDYDARREPAGWDRPGFNDERWAQVNEVEGPGGMLRAQNTAPIRAMQTFQPVKVSEPVPGVLVYDLGQNASGMPRIEISGPAGSTVKLIPGELLAGNGTVSQQSSGGPMWYSYTLKGAAQETWQPRFSYYGYRYVQVEGATRKGATATRKPVLLSLDSHFIYVSTKTAGEFTTSDPLLGRIHTLINNAIKSNMQSVLTDCPQREKLGWLEQTYLLGAALAYNYDTNRLYHKISGDIAESQLENGLIPGHVPEYILFDQPFRDSPEWGSAAVLNPWILYQFYGETDILRDQFEVMKRYVDYLTGQAHGVPGKPAFGLLGSEDHFLSQGMGDWYDIGPNPPGLAQLTSHEMTATSVYYLDLTIVQRAAALLGRAEDAEKYGALAETVRAAINKKLFHEETKQYDSGSQTANAMALAIGIVPDEYRQAVLDNLVADFRKHQNRVTAGEIGFHFVIQALTENGRSDVLYDMMSLTDGHSYGGQLAKGATTLTEAWDANPRNSQNHFMLGHGEEWLYRGLAGIDFDISRPSPRQITIKPALVGDIASAGASYDSVFGRIASNWKRENGKVLMEVVIPPGAVATVYVPALDPAKITETGTPVTKAKGVKVTGTTGSAVVFEVSSGHYRFESVIE